MSLPSLSFLGSCRLGAVTNAAVVAGATATPANAACLSRQARAIAPAVAATRLRLASASASVRQFGTAARMAQLHKPQVLNDMHPIYTSLHEAKVNKGLTFEQVAQAIGRSEWYTAAIFYGQAKPTKEDLQKLSAALSVSHEHLEAALGDGFFPHRGAGEMPPKDPTIYRLYEAIAVYGVPIKQMIHEKFGDGIMSLIAFEGSVGKIKKDGDDWVDLRLQGKFLPYRRW